MPKLRLAPNSQLQIASSRSSLFKNDHSIGKIYSKKQITNFRQSSDSFNLIKTSTQTPFRQQILLGAESPLTHVNHAQFQFSRISPEPINDNNNSSFLEISPVTNKSFRINKLYSSEMSSLGKKKKTPEIIGKLSSSKLAQQIYLKDSKNNALKTNHSRSPGHLTQRKHFRRGAKQQIAPMKNPQISRFVQFMDKNLITSQELEEKQLNPENQRLLQEVRHKQQYLRKMIEKRNKADSQQPVPHKNIQQFRYSYPVSKANTNQPNNKSKTKPFLQKIQQNSKLFEGSLVSPRFLSKVKEAALKPSAQARKSSRFNDAQQRLQRSRGKQMKISPEVDVSFTIKSPRKTLESEDKKSRVQKQAEHEVQEWRQNLSQVSLYSPEKNINFNNRKPKFVSMWIDPSKEQLEASSQTLTKQVPDVYFLAQHFSRSRKEASPQQPEQQTNFITLKTSISTLKEILIESSTTSDIRLCLPSTLFDNTKITTAIEIKDLHLFVEKVYHEMRIRPEIITIKRYKNAIFTGVFQSSTKEFNFLTSIIYHFNGSVYIGGWKQSRSPFDMHKDKVDGCKHGIGLQILYKKQENEMEEKICPNNEQKKQKTITPLVVDIYYGQFENNQRQGYGIRFRAKTAESKLDEAVTEVGCWKCGQKNGWIKSYKESKLQQNAEYQNGRKVKQLALRSQANQKVLSGQK